MSREFVGGFHWKFQLSQCIFSWFPWTPYHPDQHNRCLSTFAHCRVSAFQKPTAVSFLAELLLTFLTSSHFSQPSPGPYIRQEGVGSMLWTAWIRSLVPVSFDSHQCSNNHLYGILATRRTSYVLFWPRQCIAVGIGNVSSFGTKSWTLGSMNVIPFHRPKNIAGFSVLHHLVCWLTSVRTSSLITAEHFASYGLVAHQGGFPDPMISSRQVYCSIGNVHHFSS